MLHGLQVKQKRAKSKVLNFIHSSDANKIKYLAFRANAAESTVCSLFLQRWCHQQNKR